MNRILISAVALFISFGLHAQTKEKGATPKKNLTLEEAVLGQFRQFAPESINGLSWIPGSDRYAFVKDTTLMNDAVGKSLPTPLFTLGQLNKALRQAGVDAVKAFPSFNWLTATILHASGTAGGKNVEYTFDYASKTVSIACTYTQEGDNVDYNNAHGVAYTKENNLFVSENGTEVQVTANKRGVVSGQSISRNEYGIGKGTFWSPNGSRLAFYEKDESQVTEYPLINYNVIPAQVKNIHYPMNGDASEVVRVGIYDVKTNGIVYLKLNGGVENDQYYATNLAWTPDGNAVLVAEMDRKTTRMQLNMYSVTTGELMQTLITESDDRWVEPDQAPYFVSNTAFLWYSWRNGFHNYFLYDLTGKLLAETNAKFELLEILGMDGMKKNIYFSGTGANATELHAYQASLSDLKLIPLTKTPGTHHVQVAASGKFFIDTYNAMNVPNEVAVYDAKKGTSVKNLLTSADKLAGYNIGSTELFTIQASNGTPLYCRLIKPSNFDPEKKYPVVVYVYNGPHVQLVTNSYLGGASLWMNYLAEQGYLVFTVDGQGSAHRGKEFEQIIHRQLGTQEMKDQLAGVEWLKKQSFVDANRMAVHGWSFGGFMTTSLMVHHPGVFKVGVAGGPVIDWRMYEVMYGERYMDTPTENPEGFKNNDCSVYVSNLNGKLLMIHGADDDVVVMQHNMKFLKACVDKRVPVDFFVYPGHQHNVRGKDRVHLMNKIITYITDNL